MVIIRAREYTVRSRIEVTERLRVAWEEPQT